MTQPALLSLRDVSVVYPTRNGPLAALNGLSLDLAPGEILALVGESGSGKSTIALAIMDLLGAGKVTGTIAFKGQDLATLAPDARRTLRGRAVSLVFQDPFTSLNPSLTIGDQVAEGLIHHTKISGPAARARVLGALAEVGLPNPKAICELYPHQLSGGMRQRVLIASALICDPELLILDEPTTALDVTVEAQILDQILAIARKRNLGVLFITHNLGIVNRIADRVCVLYAGRMLELGAKEAVLGVPYHPYTKGLMACVPRLAVRSERESLKPIPGGLPDLTAPVSGCVFAPRCAFVAAGCDRPQTLERVQAAHEARCWRAAALEGTPWPREPRKAEIPSRPSTPSAKPIVATLDATKTYRAVDSMQLAKKFLQFFGCRSEGSAAANHAVRGVTLSIGKGEVLGLVGESGSGKSTIGRLILRLSDVSGGQIFLDGEAVTSAKGDSLKHLRRRLQIIFQNPDSSLNPRRTVFQTIGRVLTLFNESSNSLAQKEVEEVLDKVGLPRRYQDRYPHQLSGGEKQRVGIARAIASRPELIVCDEPVSALDVSVQATVLNLLTHLKTTFGLSYLFISHDLAVVAHMADRIAVLYAGTIMEEGPTDAVLLPPYHPYTEALISSASSPDPSIADVSRIVLRGNGSTKASQGCPFQDRCHRKIGAVCETQVPPFVEFSDHHRIACHLPREELLSRPSMLPRAKPKQFPILPAVAEPVPA